MVETLTLKEISEKRYETYDAAYAEVDEAGFHRGFWNSRENRSEWVNAYGEALVIESGNDGKFAVRQLDEKRDADVVSSNHCQAGNDCPDPTCICHTPTWADAERAFAEMVETEF